MKQFLYIIIAFIGFTSCSNSKVLSTEADLPEDIFYLDDEIKPYTGKTTIYYVGTSVVKEELRYKNDILNGETTSYYKNGNIRRKGYYAMGRLTGKWESWYENGKKEYEVEYSKDSLNGSCIVWYSTGVVERRGSYVNNNRTGDWIKYDTAGMIISKKNFH